MDKDGTELLCDILCDIVNDSSAETNKTAYANRLHDIYNTDNFRHSYAILSKKCECFFPDQRDKLVSSLCVIIEYMNQTKDDAFTSACKLLDHVELESLRLTRMDAVKNTEQSITKALQKTNAIKSDVSTANKNMNKIKDDVHDLNAQIIAVLGIFSAIIVAFFGGFSYFTSVFSNLHQLDIGTALLFSGILGFVIFNTIAILLISVSHLLNKPLEKYQIICGEKKKSFLYVIYIFSNICLILIIAIASVLLLSKLWQPIN